MIGVFDSGSGGITILQKLQQTFPDQDFIYLGDHANAPYGHRDNAAIVDMTRAGVETLMARGCTLVILACNTAAAVALRTLQQTWLDTAYPGNRILGVLVPMVEAVTGTPWHQQEPGTSSGGPQAITLFATRKTVDSGAYADEVAKRAPDIRLTAKACPGLVDAIEGGAGTLPVQGLIRGYVDEITQDTGTPDAVILGCTHFPLVQPHFKAALRQDVTLFSQPDIVSEALQDYLARHPTFRQAGTGTLTLLTTGDADRVNRLSTFLPPAYRRFHTL